MSFQAIHVRIVSVKTHWKIQVAIVAYDGQVVPYVGTTHPRTDRHYSSVNDAIVSARHLVNDILGEPPAGVPGVPVDRWNRDGDVPSDKLTGGGH